MLRILALVSGGGTNLQAIMDAIDNGGIKDTELVKVISNKADAYALERAKAHNIEAQAVVKKDFPDKESFYDALLSAVDEARPDLIVLAGFLLVLPAKMVEKYKGRIINIHPSLIPSFCGNGFYGLKVHEAELRYTLWMTARIPGPSLRRKPLRYWRAIRPKFCRSVSWNRRNG